MISLFTVMLVLMEIGRRIGIRRKKLDATGANAGLSTIDGAVFGLMGLLVAFPTQRHEVTVAFVSEEFFA